MPELNVDLDYFEHPKVMYLVDMLGEWAEILPIRLWRFTAKYHAESGEITGKSANLIERHIKWRGEKGKGIEALVECGFLEEVDGGYKVHDFMEYQGHIRAFKERGRKAAEARWKGDATSIPKARHKHTSSNALTDGRTYGADESDVTNGRTNGEPREVFNPGMHNDVKLRASKLVDLYIAETKTTHLNTKSAAIRDLAQFMLDCPKTNDSEIEHGIRLYAKQLDKNQTPFNRRQGPLRFVQDRAWESYAGMTESRALSESELLEAVRKERERNERLAT